MKRPKSTELNIYQKKELKKLFKERPDVSELEPLHRFILRYIFIEAIIKKLITYKRERQRRSAEQPQEKCEKCGRLSNPTKSIKMHLSEIKKSFRDFAIKIDFNVLDKLFKAEKGSAKLLRDSIFHTWGKDDRDQCISKIIEIEKLFDKALSSIELSIK